MLQCFATWATGLFTRPRASLRRGLVGTWVSHGNDQIQFSRKGIWSHTNARTGNLIAKGRFRVQENRLVLRVDGDSLTQEIPFKLGTDRLEFQAYFNSEYRPQATRRTP